MGVEFGEPGGWGCGWVRVGLCLGDGIINELIFLAGEVPQTGLNHVIPIQISDQINNLGPNQR